MKTGLALGGGGVSGAASLGVIKALEEEGIEITHIAGTSSGSVVAALYAYGYTVDEIMEVIPGLNKKYLDYNVRGILMKLLLFRRRFLDGWIKGVRLRGLLEKLTNGQKLDAFRIPCGIVATELRQGKPLVFAKESVPGYLSASDIEIALAVQASCSIPIVFQPVRWHDHVLADGGVTVNCPVQIVRAMGAEHVISVDTVTPFANDKIGALRSGMGIFSHVINLNLRDQMAHQHQHADYVLHPHVGYVGALEFAKVRQCVEVGYAYTRERMEEIKAILQGRGETAVKRAAE